mmetsp:Transcript_47785/g.145147  ORF Transcript_47785/g.145147 Transcript_47785/m.145147 type:complete len:214 (+) Transcript_47785:124-765(+)
MYGPRQPPPARPPVLRQVAEPLYQCTLVAAVWRWQRPLGPCSMPRRALLQVQLWRRCGTGPTPGLASVLFQGLYWWIAARWWRRVCLAVRSGTCFTQSHRWHHGLPGLPAQRPSERVQPGWQRTQTIQLAAMSCLSSLSSVVGLSSRTLTLFRVSCLFMQPTTAWPPVLQVPLRVQMRFKRPLASAMCALWCALKARRLSEGARLRVLQLLQP